MPSGRSSRPVRRSGRRARCRSAPARRAPRRARRPRRAAPAGEVLGDHRRARRADLHLDATVVGLAELAEARSRTGRAARTTPSGRRARSPARWRGAPPSSPRRPATSSARSKSGGRTTGSPVRSTDRTRLTRNVRIPASVPATRYQTDPLSTRPSGWTVRSVSLRVAVGVAEAHLDAVDDGPLQLVEVRRARPGRPAPGGGVEHDGRRRRLGVGAERLRQRLDELAQRRLGLGRRRRRRPGDHEQRPRLGRRQPAEVGAGAADQRPAAAPAGLRVDRDAGDRQRLEVAAGGLDRDLQLVGQLGGGDATLGLEHEEGGHEAIGTHGHSLAREVVIR